MATTKEKIICPECLSEGKLSELSEPEKTGEEWVQRCGNGHKLYVWCHVRAEDNLVIDVLNKKAYFLLGIGKN